jgi:hypothetical protein
MGEKIQSKMTVCTIGVGCRCCGAIKSELFEYTEIAEGENYEKIKVSSVDLLVPLDEITNTNLDSSTKRALYIVERGTTISHDAVMNILNSAEVIKKKTP